MNQHIKQLAVEAGFVDKGNNVTAYLNFDHEKFAELIVEECRTVISEVYRNTPLEFCGPLLVVDSELAEHFYGVEQ